MSQEIVTIPSPIDVHAHLREPGGEDKETIESGTAAALAGGYRAVFDMPNNPGGMQTWSADRLDEKIDIASATANIDIGFYAGVNLEDPALEEIPVMVSRAAGLKLYFGHTTGTNRESSLEDARETIDAWIKEGRRHMQMSCNELARPPILLHAREKVGYEVASYISWQEWPVHWCHVSTATEVSFAQMLGTNFPEYFTAGVTPHHLMMTERDADKWGWVGARMMPPLAKEADGDALLDAFNKGKIHILETDHAPHTTQDKMRAERENPKGHDGVDCVTCFGISGIEFVLPVMMGMVKRGKIPLERLVDALHTQPTRMLGLSVKDRISATTELAVDPYIIGEDDRVGMSSNNPYVGWLAWARVQTVTIDNQIVLPDSMERAKRVPNILKAGSRI